MHIILQTAYINPGFTLGISPQLRKLIVLEINHQFFPAVGLDKHLPDYTLQAILGTNPEISEIDVKGPLTDKRNNMLIYR